MAEPCWRVDLGRLRFDDALGIQRRLVAERHAQRIPDVLLFVEHPPTYTIGRGGKREHLLADEATLARLGADLIETDRGGDITYHGPGQVVGYPIFDLTGWRRDVHAYLRSLEAVLIEAVSRFGIRAGREPGLTGVWHPRGKIAAIGVRVARWVTSHGFALNVGMDLAPYQHIIPCGIVGRSVTSMEDVLKTPVARGPVLDAVSRAFASEFDRDVQEARPERLSCSAR